MIEQHRRLQVEWFQQPQSGFRLGRYPLPMESSLTRLAMTIKYYKAQATTEKRAEPARSL
jgi:hypothetical protein